MAAIIACYPMVASNNEWLLNNKHLLFPTVVLASFGGDILYVGWVHI